MPTIKIAMYQADKWEEVGQREVPVVPRIGETVALEGPFRENWPSADYIVYQVKHYYWGELDGEDYVLVFLLNPRDSSQLALMKASQAGSPAS